MGDALFVRQPNRNGNLPIQPANPINNVNNQYFESAPGTALDLTLFFVNCFANCFTTATRVVMHPVFGMINLYNGGTAAVILIRRMPMMQIGRETNIRYASALAKIVLASGLTALVVSKFNSSVALQSVLFNAVGGLFCICTVSKNDPKWDPEVKTICKTFIMAFSGLLSLSIFLTSSSKDTNNLAALSFSAINILMGSDCIYNGINNIFNSAIAVLHKCKVKGV